MVHESWATYVNRLFEDYSCGKHTCQEGAGDKVEPQHGDQLPLSVGRQLTWSFEEKKKKSWSSCWLIGYIYLPSVHNMVHSIRIDFVCSPELSVGFIAAAGRAHWKCGRFLSHAEVKPALTNTASLSLYPPLPPSALQRLPTFPPTRFAATRCSSANHHHHFERSIGITTSTCIC